MCSLLPELWQGLLTEAKWGALALSWLLELQPQTLSGPQKAQKLTTLQRFRAIANEAVKMKVRTVS